MTAPDSIPGAVAPDAAARGWSPADPARVVGPRAVLEVCLRAAVILLVVAVVAFVALVATSSGASDAAVDAQGAAMILFLMYALHLVALAVLGWPGGLLAAHLLRREPSERRHVAAFAVTGGALGAAVLAAWGGGVAIAVWAVIGASVAGGARAWTGHARRARASRRATHPAELV